MPGIIDPETIEVDNLPGVWSPVQWELTEEERVQELHEQATASLLWCVNMPEALLRLVLGETDIQRTFDPPEGYDPEIQGEWNNSLVTFAFKKGVRVEREQRENGDLTVEFSVEGAGTWRMEFYEEQVIIERV